MFREQKRYGKDPTVVRKSSQQTFRQPIARFKNGGYKWPAGDRVFLGSWMDFCHPGVDEGRLAIRTIIHQRPDLIFMILTKREKRYLDPEVFPKGWLKNHPNVHLYASAGNQEEMNEVMETFKKLRYETPYLGLSLEPLIEPVTLREWLTVVEHCGTCGEMFNGPIEEDKCPSCGSENCMVTTWGLEQLERMRSGERYTDPDPWIDERVIPAHVIVGCESMAGNKPGRPMGRTWAQSIAKECKKAGVSCFVKQMQRGNELIHGPDDFGWPEWAVQQNP